MTSPWLQQNWPLLLEMAIILTVSIALAYTVRKVGDRILKRFAQKPQFDPTSFRFLQQCLTAFLLILGVSLIIFKIPGVRHIAKTLITGAGILAIIVGFAAQAALANIISGIFIVIFKPYRINDIIAIRDTLTGTVEDISLRHTVIRNFENRRIVIPNSSISQEAVVNSNFAENKICKWIEFGISYTSDIDQARKIVQEEVEKHPNFMDARTEEEKQTGTPAVVVRVLALGEYAIQMRAWAWAHNSRDAFVMGCDILEAIKKRFDAEGVEIPFPYRNLIIKQSGKQEL